MTQRQSQVNVLSIKQFAELCHTTPRTLRFYEQKGLIKPYSIHPETKYRSYDAKQAREFLKLKLLQNFNITLEQIQKIIKDKNLDHELKTQLQKSKEGIISKQKEYKFLREINALMFDESVDKLFDTKWFGPYMLFCMNVQKGDYNKMNEYQQMIWREAKRLHVEVSSEQLVFYATNNYEPKGAKLELALICKSINAVHVAQDIQSNFYFRTLPKTKARVYKYTGPFNYFSLIYQKLFEYMSQNNMTIVDRVFDLYDTHNFEKKSKYETSALLAFPVEQL